MKTIPRKALSPSTRPGPERSKGARMERAAVRDYLRRKMESAPAHKAALTEVLEWMLERQRRYEARPGGLGRQKSAVRKTTTKGTK